MNVSPFFMLSIVMLTIVGLTGVSSFLLPRLTRPDIYFAVTVRPDFRQSDDGLAILGKYRREVILHSVIALALIFAGVRLRMPVLMLIGMFWQVGGFLSAFLRARRLVMPHAVQPSAVREADLGPTQTPLPGGWLAQSAPFFLLLGTGMWLELHWNQIPDRFPVHWGLDGRPNGWASRSVPGVFAPLLLGGTVCLGMLLLSYAIATLSRRIRVSGQAAALELRFKHIMLSILLGTEFFMALLFTWVGLLALRAGQAGPSPAAVLLPGLAFSALITYIVIRVGQGGTRLAGSKQSAAVVAAGPSPVGDRTLDRYWKAGMFYVNPDDPAVMVESRFGVGYTLNLGRPLSWVILILLVGVPLAFALLLKNWK